MAPIPNQVILCVDDDELILTSLEMQLKEHLGDTYLYEFAENADDALEILDELETDGYNTLLVISDWLMPGLKGDNLLIKIHQKFPKVVKVMLTGQADQEAIERSKSEANLFACLAKPWSTSDLINTIKRGLSTI
ncbi:hypothetical protein BKI52_12075 [marine bacterium AO1-C]|nr:hypothetical protein BKI52_12075 [marine bacterium AO1-C]